MADSLNCGHCRTQCEDHHKFCPECGQVLDTESDEQRDPLLGSTLPGGHVVTEQIAVGGMGRIYRAEQKALGRTVAVKIIHPHLLGDPTVESRFVTEARAASKLNHPNTVGIIDFGKFEGRFYLVMELLRGTDLAAVMHEDGPLPVDRVLDIISQVLTALAEAHHHGIIHRDLKPENIVVEALRSGGDFVKVLDFGLAQVREAIALKRITNPGMVCGTPQYMAPEQARGEDVDERADIYSCGVLLYELLTGQLPFAATSPNQLVAMHVNSLPPDPRSICPEQNIPAALVDVMMRALSEERSARYQTAVEFSDAVQSAVTRSGRGGAARPHVEELSRCQDCGAPTSRTQKFCGECGIRIRRRRFTPVSVPQAPPSAPEPKGLPLPLIGRDECFSWWDEQLNLAQSRFVAARLHGAIGTGRTRILEAFAHEAEARGSLVVCIQPDPWWTKMGYYALRDAIVQLAALNANGTDPSEWADASPEARAGLTAVFAEPNAGPPPSERSRPWAQTPPGMPDANSHRLLVTEALRWAVARAHARTETCVVLTIDDLEAVDGASRNAFTDLVADPPLVPTLLLAAHCKGWEPAWEAEATFALDGLSVVETLELVDSDEAAALISTLGPMISPMYIEQLLRFTAEEGHQPPVKLADLVALRVERLPVEARHILQAIGVLGDMTSTPQIVALLPELTDLSRHLSALRLAGLVVADGDVVGTTHSLIREVVLATTPRAVRRRLHARARRAFAVEGQALPTEAHAHHACIAGEGFDALMWLERAALQARGRADLFGAIDFLRMGVGVARQEMSRGELSDPIDAVVMFSCKLGDLLVQAGQLTDAEGVLGEALDLVGPRGKARPRILASLATVAFNAGCAETAQAHLDEALEIAREEGERDLIASLHHMRETGTVGA